MSYSGYSNVYEDPNFSVHKEEQWNYEDNQADNVLDLSHFL